MEHNENAEVNWRKIGRRTKRYGMYYLKGKDKGKPFVWGLYEEGIIKQKVKPTLFLSKSEILILNDIVIEERYRSLSGFITWLIREELKRRKIKIEKDEVVNKELIEQEKKFEIKRNSKEWKESVKKVAKLLDKH